VKACPYCGKKFNWWVRATGEYKEHVRNCYTPARRENEISRAYSCRGCPAGCFDGVDYKDEEQQKLD
jgi:Fe-S-cluster-containing dehydrogenase component